MASSNKPVYVAETKLVTERKRRHSDLVIMWHSIVGVTTIVLHELWTTFLHVWGFLELWFSSSERVEVQIWLEKYLPYVPDDFSNSWRDGRLLAILLNQLLPGCYPNARELDPDYGLKNVYKAFDVLETYFGIKPDVSAEEIVVCIDGSDIKLFNILLQLKKFTGSLPESKIPPELEPKESSEVTPSCVAKGTGLAEAFVGRMTNFMIFCLFIADLDIIVEIKGPTTLCRERITKRSPKRKKSSMAWEFPKLLLRSTSMIIEKDQLISEEENIQKNIPLEYEIIGNQISVGYRPKEKGQHKVSILWHGQHASDSPYFVNVEDPFDVTAANYLVQRKSVLKTSNRGEKEEMKKNAVRFEEARVKCREQTQPTGRVLSRKIIRYIVRVSGKDIAINAESTDSLATELLKMEYDFETCPSLHRRNSWGFAGDAERKKSVIRQFGIDADELEAQISVKRTRSLSVYPESKKLLEKSDSLDSKLNIVDEVISESNDNVCENEADYAYINEDVLENNETSMNEILENEMSMNTESETNASRDFEDSFTESFMESGNESFYNKTESYKISFLSTEDTLEYAVDNLNDDLQPDQLFISLPNNAEGYSSKFESTIKSPFNCSNSVEALNKHNRNFDEHYGISRTTKYLCPMCKNYKNKNLRRKQCQKNKKYSKNKKEQKTAKQVILKESPTPKAIVTTVPIRRKWRNVKRPVLERKNSSSVNILKCLKNLDIVAFKTQKTDESTDNALISKQSTSDEILETTSSLFMIDNSNLERSVQINEESCLNVNDNRKISDTDQPVGNHSNKKESKLVKKKSNDFNYLRNSRLNGDPLVKVDAERKISIVKKPIGTMLDKQQTDNINKRTKHEIKEPKINKISLNRNIREMFTPVEPTMKEIGLKPETSTSLRTHTLKTMELLNLKQFSLPFDPQSSSSPIKSQITQWENNLSSDFSHSNSRKTSASIEIEQVSVKERLAFWENNNKAKNNIPECVSENNRKISLVDSKSSRKSSESENIVTENDLFNIPRTDKRHIPPVSYTKRKVERNSLNTEAAKKDMDQRKTPDFELNDNRIRRRSFSDPGVMEASTWELPYLPPSSESLGKSCLNFSNDNNLESLYSSDESDDFSDDFSRNSMSDEYIDDEISENASEYWGDLSLVKDLKVARCSIDSAFWVTDFLQNQHQQLKSFPEQCKVFGIAVYYGYVAVKNRFKVYTGDSGFGNLSVSVQGFRRHDVSLVSVVYVRKDVYEVTYQVMTKGYYLISIRWMEKEIPGSPFVCKVTF